MEPGLADAAQLFKVLGSESRLWLLRLLGESPRTVGALTEATGMSQPLVSQHLKTLRQGCLVAASRNGKEVTYRLADLHVSHVIVDALAHVQEPAEVEKAEDEQRKERTAGPPPRPMPSTRSPSTRTARTAVTRPCSTVTTSTTCTASTDTRSTATTTTSTDFLC